MDLSVKGAHHQFVFRRPTPRQQQQQQEQQQSICYPPLHCMYVALAPPLVLYLYVSFKNKTQTELERTEQCDGIEGAQFEIFKQIR